MRETRYLRERKIVKRKKKKKSHIKHNSLIALEEVIKPISFEPKVIDWFLMKIMLKRKISNLTLSTIP